MKFKDRTGESRIMKCGMKATIIAYRNAMDIDVQFEDGTIVKHKRYSCFIKGNIKHPNFTPKGKAQSRLGETRMMKCGINATIITYRKFSDIDVQFEDGTIAKHVQYGNFIIGNIKHPNFTPEAKAQSRLGETRMMKCGMKATIIAYRGCDDIDIQFEDGAIVKHKNYGNFIIGNIKHPNFTPEAKAQSRLGETRMMKCGINATIITYRKFSDIDVQFEDGTIVKHKHYSCFIKGSISHPNFTPEAKAQSRLGETRMMKCGMKATIVAYRKSSDIDVQFEDGTIVKHVRYGSFIIGNIKHPNFSPKAKAKSRLGETQIMNCGMKATIIGYRSAADIDVQFEDGAIVKHRAYKIFCIGGILHPFISKGRTSAVFYEFKNLSFAFKSCGQVFYYCTAPDGERKILTLRQMLEQSGITPLF